MNTSPSRSASQRAKPPQTAALAAVVASLVFVAAGCRSTSGSSEAFTSATAGGPTDTSIESKLAILDYRTVGQGAERAAEFDLQNQTGDRLDFHYVVDWFDTLGKPVAFRSHAWTPLAIDARARVHVRVAPMPAEARSSRLRFSSTGGRP